jgi:nucleoside-diphosphate-sugar epimerase
MDMTSVVAIAGAGGWLGQKIAAAVLDAGGVPRLLLRGGEHHPKAAQLSGLVGRGALIVPADVSDPASLGAALAGAEVIVSALQGGPDTIIDGQRALALAGKAAGVARIFPSDFAVDFSAIPVEDHLFLGWRKLAQAAIADTGLPQTNTYIGAFTEMLRQPFFGLIDWDRAVVTHWGDADQPYDFTTTDDTAHVVVAAALGEGPPDRLLRFAGDTRSPAEIAAIAGRVTGRPFDLRSLGDVGTLRDRIAAQRMAAPDTPHAWVGLQYHLAMASGAGKLTQVHNENFPEVVPTSVERFLSESL